MSSKEIFLQLLKSALTEEKLNTNLSPSIVSDASLFTLSASHSVSNVIAESLSANGIDIAGTQFEMSAIHAVQNDAQIEAEFSSLKKAFEEVGVPFIPLKALVLKQYYPETQLRTCGDMDILVHKDDLQKAVNALVNYCGYTTKSYNHHDVAMISPYGVNLELHFSTSYDEEKLDSVLARIWDYAAPADKGCEYKLTDDFFLFYIIAHIYHHFVTGGCGIRFFMDLWVIKHRIGIEYTEIVKELCNDAGIEKFAESTLYLTEVWFEDAEYTDTTRDIEEYIFSGGTFGNSENEAARASVTARKSGRVQYNLKRMLLPYDRLKLLYPDMQGWQFPAYEIKRWGGLLKKGMKHRIEIARQSRVLSDDKQESIRKLYQELGIE